VVEPTLHLVERADDDPARYVEQPPQDTFARMGNPRDGITFARHRLFGHGGTIAGATPGMRVH